MAIVVITEAGIRLAEITEDDALIIAQHARNLHTQIIRQLAAQNGAMPAAPPIPHAMPDTTELPSAE